MKKTNTLLVTIFSLIFCFSFLLMNNPIVIAIQNSDSTNPNFETIFSTEFIWNDVEVVSGESTSVSNFAKIDIDIYGNIFTVWDDYTNYLSSGADIDIFYKKKLNTSDTWTTTEVISTESSLDSRSPVIAVDDLGNIHVAWFDATDYASSGADIDIFYKRYDVDLAGWTLTEIISYTSNDQCYNPAIALDNLGNLHVTWEDWTTFDGLDPDIMYRKWIAASKTWSSVGLVSVESSDFSFNPDVCTDSEDNVHFVWHEATNDLLSSGADRDIFYKKWNAETVNWEELELVSTSADDSDAPSIVSDSSDNLHIVWHEVETYSQIYYSYREYGQLGWSNYQKVSSNDGEAIHNPHIDVDIFDNVHIAWYSSAGNAIIYKGLLTPLRVPTGELTVNSIGQTSSAFPCLKTDNSGLIHTIWTSVAGYGASGSDQDIFYRLFGSVPVAPTLQYIFPNPTETNLVNLLWNDNPAVNRYHVFRSTLYITDIQSLSPVFSTTETQYTDTLSSEGVYYYVLIAENKLGNSSISNCLYVHYILPHLREFAITTSIILSVSVVLLVMNRFRRKRDSN